jgi:hypothetical protein
LNLHPLYALGLLAAGWFGFALRRTSIGGMVAGLVSFQGVLAMGALAVFASGRKEAGAGAVFLWVIAVVAFAFLVVALTLALRQYYSHRSVKWIVNEEVKR